MKTILVLTDFSEKAETAAEFALRIASEANAKVMLYHFFVLPQAFPSEGGIYPYYEASSEKMEIEAALGKLASRLSHEFISVTNLVCPEISWKCEPGPISGKIEKISSDTDVWMIMMGDQSEEETINQFLFGNESRTVIEEAQCPIMLIPENSVYKPIAKVIFASEMNSSEQEALNRLESIATVWNSRIQVVHISGDNYDNPEIIDYEQQFRELISGSNYKSIAYDVIYGSDIPETLNNYADEQSADMVVLIHKKRSKIKQLMHRSISKAMLNYHQVPMLILQK